MEGLGGPIRMDEYNFDGIDPTLDACCQRELENNRYGNALTRTLQRNDVVAMAERRRRHLVTTPDNFTGCRCCYDPNSDGGEYMALIELREKRAKQQQDGAEDDHSRQSEGEEKKVESQPITETSDRGKDKDNDDSDSDDEFDYLLDEDIGDNDSMFKQAEERRRAELEMVLLTQQILKQHGYGVHRQMHPSRILRAAGLGEKKKNETGIAPAVVVHLVDPESVASASLDLFLEELAGSAEVTPSSKSSNFRNLGRGTKFMRSGGRSTLLMDAELATKVLPKLQPDRDLPALVAIRDGIVVNTCPRLSGLTTDPMTDEVDEDAVHQWLDRCGVLLPEAPRFDEVCRIRPEEEALMDYLDSAPQVAEEQRFNCGNPDCSKSFPHEHVGIQNEQQSGLVVSEEEVVGNSSEIS